MSLGGARADTFTSYPWITTATPGGRAEIFAFAEDTATFERLFNSEKTGCRKITSKLPSNVNNTPGTTYYSPGNSLVFYCTNYTAPQHRDHDEGWSIAANYGLEGYQGYFSSFSFSEWATVIQMKRGLVWLFNSAEPHGKYFDEGVSENVLTNTIWESLGIVIVQRQREVHAQELQTRLKETGMRAHYIQS